MQDTLFIEEHKLADHYTVNVLKHRDPEGKTHTIGIFSDENAMDARPASSKKEK